LEENDETRFRDESSERSLGARMFGERVLDAVPETVFVLDPTGRLVWWNRHATAATGYDDAELATLDPVDLVHESERERFETWIDSLLAGALENPVVETQLIDADGESTPYEFVGALLDGHDGVSGAVATGRDISERRARQELERQNERLEEFAGVVSHDLRNPLTVAEGYLSLAQLEHQSEDLVRVAEAHKRMYDLIDDLLTLARAGMAVGETEPVEIGTIARQGWASVDTGAGELTIEGEATLEADPRRLRELFENLFRNAVEHGSTGREMSSHDAVGHGTTSSASRTRRQTERGTGTDATPSVDAEGVSVFSSVTVAVGPLADDGGFYVEDDGPGIPEEVREDIFESGYTTSERGTGFGLAIVEDIAEAHGWTVSIHEGRTGGARFEVEVPGPNAPE
jgi:PAS domain S-box-containing protein